MYGWRLQKPLNGVVLRIPGVPRLLSRSTLRTQVFQLAYSTRAWGSAESASGSGSELAATENVRAYLPELFHQLPVSRFLDAPCGDWSWMRRVNLSGIDYFGVEVVSNVVARTTRNMPVRACNSFTRISVRMLYPQST